MRIEMVNIYSNLILLKTLGNNNCTFISKNIYLKKKSSMLKKILSYFIPINLHKINSEINQTLEITLVNGELVLDTKNTNYSYGSLQRILRKGLLNIGYNKIQKMNHILILGVGGGSVIKTLVEEVNFNNKITGIELDPTIIEVAKNYFDIDKISNLNIIIDDAFEFVLKTKLQYDLILIDIFQDTVMPNFLFEDFFRDRVCDLLMPSGVILFNTMILKASDDDRNMKYLNGVNKEQYTTSTIPRVEQHNELILIEKKNV
jgi:spermidine synthase